MRRRRREEEKWESGEKVKGVDGEREREEEKLVRRVTNGVTEEKRWGEREGRAGEATIAGQQYTFIIDLTGCD